MLLPFIFVLVLLLGLAMAAKRRRAAGLIPMSVGCAIYIFIAAIAKIGLESIRLEHPTASVGLAIGVYAVLAALVFAGVSRWLLVPDSSGHLGVERTPG